MGAAACALRSASALIRFDHRGHGGSPVPGGPYSIADLGGDVLALMDRLGLERASYCGLSIGGMVGQWLAINAPERIEQLILICTRRASCRRVHWPSAPICRAGGAAAPRSSPTPSSAAGSRRRSPRLIPSVVAGHRAMIAATPAEGYAGCCEAIAALDLRAGLLRRRALRRS